MMNQQGNVKRLIDAQKTIVETPVRTCSLSKKTLMIALDGSGACSATVQFFGVPEGEDKRFSIPLTDPITISGTPTAQQVVTRVEKLEIECPGLFAKVTAITGTNAALTAWIGV